MTDTPARRSCRPVRLKGNRASNDQRLQTSKAGFPKRLRRTRGFPSSVCRTCTQANASWRWRPLSTSRWSPSDSATPRSPSPRTSTGQWWNESEYGRSWVSAAPLVSPAGVAVIEEDNPGSDMNLSPTDSSWSPTSDVKPHADDRLCNFPQAGVVVTCVRAHALVGLIDRDLALVGGYPLGLLNDYP